MDKLLLSVHVLAAIIFVGPVTVAVSLFPRYARQAVTARPGVSGGRAGPLARHEPGTGAPEDGVVAAAGEQHGSAAPVARLLHRISRVYAVLGLSVPVLGIALAVQLGVLTDTWLLVSIVLTLLAALILATVVLPAQQRAMDLINLTSDPVGGMVGDWSAEAKRQAMASGIFSLLWAIVVVLMVLRPGSTTGV